MAIAFCGKRVILTRNSLFKTLKRKNGYIILLPEIGEDLPDKDPLLKKDGLPEFNTFTIEKSMAAIGKQTVLYEQGIKKIEKDITSSKEIDVVKQIIDPLEELNVPIETTWGISKALFFGNQSLMPSKYYQSIHNRMINVRSEKFTSLPLFNACNKALKNEELNLSAEQRKIIEKYVLEGKLNGLELDEKNKSKFTASVIKLIQKSNAFEEKLEYSTANFKTTLENEILVKDFPEDFLKEIAIDKNNYQKGPWKITLQPKVVSQFLKCCPDRQLRRNVWNAQNTRCSMGGDNLLRTSTDLEDIRDLRQRQAKVLGYKSFSHMSMTTKVAGSLENIYRVMDSLLTTAKPVQAKEFDELTAFANDRGFSGEIRQWDIDYWSRKHLRSVYNIKDEILQEYFPLPQVLKGLFGLIEKLFNVKIIEGKKTDVWHSDVRFFDVIDLKDSNDTIAHFYLDPYSRREDKISLTSETGWTVAMQNKSKLMNTKPLAALIFNFKPPNGDIPSLLTINDVHYLFQKVGSALPHLLTRVGYSEIAGISNVEWDAVEICGHFMTNWLYEPALLKQIACHYKTNEPLPADIIENLKCLRSHMAGYNLCKELYLGRLDLKIHEKDEFWARIVKNLYQQHFVIPQDENDSFLTSWAAIFNGGWGAAYYSNLWSEMMAADIYSAFQEIPAEGINEKKELGLRFRDTFLSLGGSVPAGEVFRRFRGRDPNSKALLKNRGLKEESSEEIQ